MSVKSLSQAESAFKVAAEKFQQLDTRTLEKRAFDKIFGPDPMTRDEAAQKMQSAFNTWRDMNPSTEQKDALFKWCSVMRPALYQWLQYHYEH